MSGGSGGGGNGGRSGGGSGSPGAPESDTDITSALRDAYGKNANVQQLPNATQVTHEKATVRIYDNGNAEVWSSPSRKERAYKPVAGSLKTYKDPVKALTEFEKRTGLIT